MHLEKEVTGWHDDLKPGWDLVTCFLLEEVHGWGSSRSSVLGIKIFEWLVTGNISLPSSVESHVCMAEAETTSVLLSPCPGASGVVCLDLSESTRVSRWRPAGWGRGEELNSRWRLPCLQQSQPSSARLKPASAHLSRIYWVPPGRTKTDLALSL